MPYKGVKVKICGIRDPRTAYDTAMAGADAVGMVFAPSRRQVTPEQAREICQALPPLITRVGIFVDAAPKEVREIVNYCGLDVVQLHGQESPEYCRELGLRCIKAVAVRDGRTLEQADAFPVSAILADTYHPKEAGGTGKTFDWSIMEDIRLKRPLILAGGLHPGNVGRAVALLKPYGVDVSSGVEINGQKDITLIQAFISRAREVYGYAAG
ncbi:phosphoribosylanthranilate isomerase [Desulforamulus ruminis]|uniref:N-(5'-phosphoribosyl)anthranilate isomerase n=1 Tax=Desulforamulus ruminis (strain ATCC 23193 / DSM 2154 / NCIMB 8452 / DL) TaxID=696281 RepID=F6DPQ9_DESRL|nr:phosphoribosylanthranilate isomerase [Desulforamulus ruminis]AEG59636.1 Phosphoribosylanthranilate isomerase [Desulforamulus ruminis DSM 2154]